MTTEKRKIEPEGEKERNFRQSLIISLYILLISSNARILLSLRYILDVNC